MQPWRPFKALCSTARSDEYALNVSWSLDSSRLIVVNTAVSTLNVSWSLDSSRLIVVNTAVSSIFMPQYSKILRAHCFWSVSVCTANFNVFQ